MSDQRGLIDRILDLPGDDGGDPRAATFVRGLFLGALVGAAIAGSTIWQRRQAARESAQHRTAAGAGADSSPSVEADSTSR